MTLADGIGAPAVAASLLGVGALEPIAVVAMPKHGSG